MAKSQKVSKQHYKKDEKRIAADIASNTFAPKMVKLSMPLPAVAPQPLDYFVGRKEILHDIKIMLTKDTQSKTIVILGMGGIGKTALAKQIADSLKKYFSGGIFWGDELPMQNSNPYTILKQWGRLCGQNLETEVNENIPGIVRELLSIRLKTGPILVVIDDARLDFADGLNLVKKALPADVPMMITTRQLEVVVNNDLKVFNLDVLSREESCQLLVNLSEKIIPLSIASEISELCGDMPLALVLIARLSKRRPINLLLEQLRNQTKRLNLLKLDGIHKKDQNVRVCFDISYQAFSEKGPGLTRIFRELAVFSQPAFIICKYLPQYNNQQDAFMRLANGSLLIEEKNIDGHKMQYFHIHPLIHDYARDLLMDSIDLDQAIKNHIKYCVSFSKAYFAVDMQPDQKNIDEFEKSHGQLRQALKYIKDIYLPKVIDWKREANLAHQIISLVEVLDHYGQLIKLELDMEWLEIAAECANALKQSVKEAGFRRRINYLKRQEN